MSLHLSERLLEKFRRGGLSADELAAFDEHLAGCAECGRRVAGEDGGAGAFAAARASLRRAAREDFTHLQFEEMEALVNGALGGVEREVAETHLSVCAACAEDLADLRAFREELEAEPLHSTEAPTAKRPTGAGLLERLRAALRPLSLGFPLSYALAAVLLLLVFGGAVFFALRQREGEQRELANKNAATATPEVARAVGPTPAPTAQPAESLTPQPERSPAPPSDEQQLALSLADGEGTVGLDSRGELVGLDALAPAERRQVREALAGGRVETAAALPSRAGALLGAGSDGVPFRLRGPVGVAIRSRRPALSWEPLAGAGSYTVTVVDESGHVVAKSGELKATAWTPPNDLVRGATYSWQVAAQKGGAEVISPAPPAPEARFKILDAVRAASLARAERDARGSHVALGVLYARAGLLDEAERELSALLRRNPQSDIARRLLQSVRAQRRTSGAKR